MRTTLPLGPVRVTLRREGEAFDAIGEVTP